MAEENWKNNILPKSGSLDLSNLDYDENTSLEDIAGKYQALGSEVGNLAQAAAKDVGIRQQKLIGNNFGAVSPNMYSAYYQPNANDFQSAMRVKGTEVALGEGMKRGKAAAEANLENSKKNYQSSLDAYNNAKTAFANLQVAMLPSGVLPDNTDESEAASYKQFSDYGDKNEAENERLRAYTDAQGVDWSNGDIWSKAAGNAVNKYAGDTSGWGDEQWNEFWSRDDVSRDFAHDYVSEFIAQQSGSERQAQFEQSYEYCKSVIDNAFDYAKGIVDNLNLPEVQDVFYYQTKNQDASTGDWLEQTLDGLISGGQTEEDKYRYTLTYFANDEWIDKNIAEEYREDVKKAAANFKQDTLHPENENAWRKTLKQIQEENPKWSVPEAFAEANARMGKEFYNYIQDKVPQVHEAQELTNQSQSDLLKSLTGFDTMDLMWMTTWKRENPDEYDSYQAQLSQVFAQTNSIEVADGERYYYTNEGYVQLPKGTPVFFALDGALDEEGKPKGTLKTFVDCWNDFYSADTQEKATKEELSSKQDALNQAYADYMQTVSLAAGVNSTLNVKITPDVYDAILACQGNPGESDYEINGQSISEWLKNFQKTASDNRDWAYKQFNDIMRNATSRSGSFMRYSAQLEGMYNDKTKYDEGSNAEGYTKTEDVHGWRDNEGETEYANLDPETAAAYYLVLTRSMEKFNQGNTNGNVDPVFTTEGAFEYISKGMLEQTMGLIDFFAGAGNFILGIGDWAFGEEHNAPWKFEGIGGEGFSAENVIGSIFTGNRTYNMDNGWQAKEFLMKLDSQNHEVAQSVVNPLLIDLMLGNDEKFKENKGVGGKYTRGGIFDNWTSMWKFGVDIGEMFALNWMEGMAMNGLATGAAKGISAVANSKAAAALELKMFPHLISRMDDSTVAANIANSPTFVTDLTRTALHNSATWVDNVDDPMTLVNMLDNVDDYTYATNNPNDVVQLALDLGENTVPTKVVGTLPSQTAAALSSLDSTDLATMLTTYSTFGSAAGKIIESSEYGKYFREIGDIILANGTKVSAAEATAVVTANRVVGASTLSLATGIDVREIAALPDGVRTMLNKTLNNMTANSQTVTSSTLGKFLRSMDGDDFKAFVQGTIDRVNENLKFGKTSFDKFDLYRAAAKAGWEKSGTTALAREFITDALTDPLRDFRRNASVPQIGDDGNAHVQTVTEYFTSPENLANNLFMSALHFGVSRAYNQIAGSVTAKRAAKAWDAYNSTGYSSPETAMKLLNKANNLTLEAQKYADKAWHNGMSYEKVLKYTDTSNKALDAAFAEIFKSNKWDINYGKVKKSFDTQEDFVKYITNDKMPAKDGLFTIANSLGLKATNNYYIAKIQLGTGITDLGTQRGNTVLKFISKFVESGDKYYDEVKNSKASIEDKIHNMYSLIKADLIEANKAGEFGIKMTNFEKSVDSVMSNLEAYMRAGIADGTLNDVRLAYFPISAFTFDGTKEDMIKSHDNAVARGLLMNGKTVDMAASNPAEPRDKLDIHDIIKGMQNGDETIKLRNSKGEVVQELLLDYDGLNMLDIMTVYSNNYNIHKYIDPVLGDNRTKFGYAALRNGNAFISMEQDKLVSSWNKEVGNLKNKFTGYNYKDKNGKQHHVNGWNEIIIRKSLEEGLINEKQAASLKKTGKAEFVIDKEAADRLNKLNNSYVEARKARDSVADIIKNGDTPDGVYGIVSDIMGFTNTKTGEKNVELGKAYWDNARNISSRLVELYNEGEISPDNIGKTVTLKTSFKKKVYNKDFLITNSLVNMLDGAAKDSGAFNSDLTIWALVYNDFLEPYASKTVKNGVTKYKPVKGYESKIKKMLEANNGKTPFEGEENAITTFRGDNAYLSNMFDAPVEYMGKTYKNAEAAFQAQKARYVKQDSGKQLTNPGVKKIISGGQTGVDTYGLEIARELGIETGGTAAPGFWTENKANPKLKEYGLEEISKELQGKQPKGKFYNPRTEQNVINSDGTVYFATDADSAGLNATRGYAKKNNKPFLLNPTADELNKWLADNKIEKLNVAGNRGSKIGDMEGSMKDTLRRALGGKTETRDASSHFYSGKITPEENTVFVFGSNPEGRHGLGSAKIAVEQFGAVDGQGEGLQGNSYAIPTKDLRVKENNSYRSIPQDKIIESIKKMYATAEENPDKTFKVAYTNKMDEKTLNGYTGKEMQQMFFKAAKQYGHLPKNVMFSDVWNTSTKASNKPVDFTQLSGKDARAAGKTMKNLDIDRWNEAKFGIMDEIVKAKFDQNPELAKKLKATKGKIAEYNDWGDTTWGVDSKTKQGTNALGQILQNYREGGINEYTWNAEPNTRSLRNREIKDFNLAKADEMFGTQGGILSFSADGTHDYDLPKIYSQIFNTGRSNAEADNYKARAEINLDNLENLTRDLIMDAFGKKVNSKGEWDATPFEKRFADLINSRVKTELGEEDFSADMWFDKVDSALGGLDQVQKYNEPVFSTTYLDKNGKEKTLTRSIASMVMGIENDGGVELFREDLAKAKIRILAGEFDDILPENMSPENLIMHINRTLEGFDGAEEYNNRSKASENIKTFIDEDGEEVLDEREMTRYNIKGETVDENENVVDTYISGRGIDTTKQNVDDILDSMQIVLKALYDPEDELHQVICSKEYAALRDNRLDAMNRIKGLTSEITKEAKKLYDTGNNTKFNAAVDTAFNNISARQKVNKEVKNHYLEALGIAAPETGLKNRGSGNTMEQYNAAQLAMATGIQDTSAGEGYSPELTKMRLEAGTVGGHVDQIIKGIETLRKFAGDNKAYTDIYDEATALRSQLNSVLAAAAPNSTDNFENSFMSMLADVTNPKSAISMSPKSEIEWELANAKRRLENKVKEYEGVFDVKKGKKGELISKEGVSELAGKIYEEVQEIKRLKRFNGSNLGDEFHKNNMAEIRQHLANLKTLTDPFESPEKVVSHITRLFEDVSDLKSKVDDLNAKIESYGDRAGANILTDHESKGKMPFFDKSFVMYTAGMKDTSFTPRNFDMGNDLEIEKMFGSETENNYGTGIRMFNSNTLDEIDLDTALIGEGGARLATKYNTMEEEMRGLNRLLNAEELDTYTGAGKILDEPIPYGEYYYVKLRDEREEFDNDNPTRAELEHATPTTKSPEQVIDDMLYDYAKATKDYVPSKQVRDAKDKYNKASAQMADIKKKIDATSNSVEKKNITVNHLADKVLDYGNLKQFKTDVDEWKRLKGWDKNSDIYTGMYSNYHITSSKKIPSGYTRLSDLLEMFHYDPKNFNHDITEGRVYTEDEIKADRKAHKKMQKEVNKNLNSGKFKKSRLQQYKNPEDLDLKSQTMTINNLLAFGEQAAKGAGKKGELTASNIIVNKDYAELLVRVSREGIAPANFNDNLKGFAFQLTDWNKFIQNFQLAGGVSWINALSLAQLRGAIFSDPLKMKQYIQLCADFKDDAAVANFAIKNSKRLTDIAIRVGDTTIFTDFQASASNAPGVEDGGSLGRFASKVQDSMKNKSAYESKYEWSKDLIQNGTDVLFGDVTFQRMLPVLRAKMIIANYDKAVRTIQKKFPNIGEEELNDAASKFAYAKVLAFFEPGKTTSGIFHTKNIEDVLKTVYDERLRSFLSDVTGATSDVTMGEMASNCFFALGYKNRMIQPLFQGVRSIFSPPEIKQRFSTRGKHEAFKDMSISNDEILSNLGTSFMQSGNRQQIVSLATLAAAAFISAKSLGLATSWDDLNFQDEEDLDENGNPKFAVPEILKKFQTIGQIWVPNDYDPEMGTQWGKSIAGFYVNPNKHSNKLDTMSSMFTLPNSLWKTLDRMGHENGSYSAPQRGVGLIGQMLGINPQGVNDVVNWGPLRAIGDEMIGANLLSPYKAMYEILVDSSYYGNNIWEKRWLSDGSENPNYDPGRNMVASFWHILGFDTYNDTVKGRGTAGYKEQDQVGTVGGAGIFQHEYFSAIKGLISGGDILEAITEAGELPIKTQKLSSTARTDFNVRIKNIIAQYMAEYRDVADNTTDASTKDKAYQKAVKRSADAIAGWSKKWEYVLGYNQDLVPYVTRSAMAMLAGEYDDRLAYIQNTYWKASALAQIEASGPDEYWLDDADAEEWRKAGKSTEEFAAEKTKRTNAYYDTLDAEYKARKALHDAGVDNEYLAGMSVENLRAEQRAVNREVFGGVMSKLESRVGEFDNYKEMKAYYETQIEAADTTTKKAKLARQYNDYVTDALAPYIEKYGAAIVADGYYNGNYLSNWLADFIIIPADEYYGGKSPHANYIRDLFHVGFRDGTALPSDNEVIEGYTKAKAQINKGYNASASSILDSVLLEIKKGRIYASDSDYSKIVRLKALLSARSK